MISPIARPIAFCLDTPVIFSSAVENSHNPVFINGDNAIMNKVDDPLLVVCFLFLQSPGVKNFLCLGNGNPHGLNTGMYRKDMAISP